MSQRVVVLGASARRVSGRAVDQLLAAGHRVVPVHPQGGEIHGLEVVPGLGEIEGPIDTLSVYIRPSISDDLADEILDLSPGWVIFNPGSENPALASRLESAGVDVANACTLVLLSFGSFG